MIYPSKQISVSIKRSVSDVYDFASKPMNLPKWAAGLSGSSIVKEGEQWIVESPMGRVKVKFAEPNQFGVIDHDVTLPSGEVNHNPFRVLKNGDGSEVVFTLYRMPKMSDEDFQRDAAMIRSDLNKLKSILEK